MVIQNGNRSRLDEVPGEAHGIVRAGLIYNNSNNNNDNNNNKNNNIN